MADYIEREATVELLRSLGSRGYRREKGTIQDAIKMIQSPAYTPSADVAPVKADKWIRLPSMGLEFECPTCGWQYEWFEPWEEHFCPRCGTKKNGVAE